MLSKMFIDGLGVPQYSGIPNTSCNRYNKNVTNQRSKTLDLFVYKN